MNSESVSSSRPRGIVRWLIAIIFGLLAAGFLARVVQYGYNWLTHAPSRDVNYKVVTIAALIYAAICAAIALIAFRGGDRADSSA